MPGKTPCGGRAKGRSSAFGGDRSGQNFRKTSGQNFRNPQEWLQLNGVILFEAELEGWYTDPSLWPQERSVELFRKWCTFELHSLAYATGGSPLEDDEAPTTGPET